MGFLRRLTRLVQQPARTYGVVPVKSETTDIRIEHASGVILQIEHDGTVIVSSPGNLECTRMGPAALVGYPHRSVRPRIDLN